VVRAAVAAVLFVVMSSGQPRPRAPRSRHRRRAAAKAHFLAGSAYYEQANYTDAVKEFSEAHRLSHRAISSTTSASATSARPLDDAIASLQQY